jgi:hypothetical protein
MTPSTMSSNGDPTSESSGSMLAQTQIISLGCARHECGDCKPCIFVHTHLGCAQGASCTFCHYPHKRRGKQNPCKDKRHRYRKLLARVEVEHAEALALAATGNGSTVVGI